MKTILEAIKLYPQKFIDTLQRRADTTPSEVNRENHLSLVSYIEQEDDLCIVLQLLDPTYYNPLEGVIFCLERYSGIDKDVWF